MSTERNIVSAWCLVCVVIHITLNDNHIIILLYNMWTYTKQSSAKKIGNPAPAFGQSWGDRQCGKYKILVLFVRSFS